MTQDEIQLDEGSVGPVQFVPDGRNRVLDPELMELMLVALCLVFSDAHCSHG